MKALEMIGLCSINNIILQVCPVCSIHEFVLLHAVSRPIANLLFKL